MKHLRTKKIYTVAFCGLLILALVQMALLIYKYEWFTTHLSVDWKKILPACQSLRMTTPILIIESDDWGWSEGNVKETWQSYVEAGYELPNFARYSALETPEEVAALSAMLNSHRDSQGNPAVFTANFIMANIDFDARACCINNLFFLQVNNSSFSVIIWAMDC